MTPPAIVDMPHVIMQKISERVNFARYGRTAKGASHIPKKMFATAITASEPLIPMVFETIFAKQRMTACMMPK